MTDADDNWSTGEKAEVGLTLGEGALHGPLAAIGAGIIAAVILWWRSGSQRHRNADAD